MSVKVLCPNGRRHVVKVKPNTTVLQILEEAASKAGVDPDQYNLKHLLRVVSVDRTVREASLPNNCQLEMVVAPVPRVPRPVSVHLAQESGSRLTHDFLPSTTLVEILCHMEASGSSATLLPEASSGREAVLVYGTQRISGPKLHTTTLKTLGILSGSCLFRHSLQECGLSTQAHVSAPLSRPQPANPSHPDSSASPASQHPEVCSSSSSREEPSKSEESQCAREAMEVEAPAAQPSPPQQAEQSSLSPQQAPQPSSYQPAPSQSGQQSPQQSSRPQQVQSWVGEGRMLGGGKKACSQQVQGDGVSEGRMENVASSASEQDHHSPTPAVVSLGSHNAILFSMEDAPATHAVEEDDKFFELSPDEAKRLYHQNKSSLQEMEEMPLLTKRLREMEKSARTLRALNRYPVTNLRIFFPDQHVIQASFKTTDTVGQVMEFIRPFLADPSWQFELQLRHPSRVLVAGETLVEAECAPNARLYFHSLHTPGPHCLSPNTLALKSSFASAFSTLTHTKKREEVPVDSRGNEVGMEGSLDGACGNISVEEEPQATCQLPHTSAAPPRTSASTAKVPKWFKLGK